MTSSPIAPGSRLASRLGFSDRVFIGPAARRVARAIEDGLERVETGLAEDVRVADPLADAASRYLYEAAWQAHPSRADSARRSARRGEHG